MFADDYIGKRIEVWKNGRCVCRGYGVQYKDSYHQRPVNFISTDYITFFNLDSAEIEVKVLPDTDPKGDLTYVSSDETPSWSGYNGPYSILPAIMIDLENKYKDKDPNEVVLSRESRSSNNVDGCRFRIVDRNTGELLAQGKVITEKNQLPCGDITSAISFDNRWFFVVKSDMFRISKTDDPTEVPFTKWDNYDWKYWRNATEFPDAPIYRDFDITEVDPEVKSLVEELNKWPHVETLQSCSGHGNGPLWVRLSVSDITELSLLTKPLMSIDYPWLNGRIVIPFNNLGDRFINFLPAQTVTSVTAPNYMMKDGAPAFSFLLATTEVGEPAYVCADRYAKLLSQIREMVL